MTQIFFNSLINKDFEALCGKLSLVIIMWGIVLVAIVIDLISGLQKVSKQGKPHTSLGFRRTVTKTVQYYGLMCFAFMFDILSSLVLPLPYFTMIASCFLVFIEAKSVFENIHNDDRKRINRSIKDLIIMIENKDDLLNGIVEILKETEKENDEHHSE